MNSIRLSLLCDQLEGVAEVMGVALARSAFSPNIRVRLDFSCALFTPQGKLLAQAAHIPVHLGSMPDQIKTLVSKNRVEPGDLYLANDPYEGGTHLPDITLMEPVFSECSKHLLGIVAARAHHADVGGVSPGSMSSQSSIYGDGLRIPILRIAQNGEWDQNLLKLILCNLRCPSDRHGDLLAQRAACFQGANGLRRVFSQWAYKDSEKWARGQNALLKLSYQGTLEALATNLTLKDVKSVHFSDLLEIGDENVTITVTLDFDESGRLRADFCGTGSAPRSGFNATLPVTKAALCYCLRCIVGDDLPFNQGFLDCIVVEAPKGSVVHAQYPLAVAAGNVETSQRIVDVIFGALAQIVPEIVPAASAGSMNNISFGFDSAESGVHYETSGGGAGACFQGTSKAGSALQVHMTNTLSTPVEVLETEFPVRVDRHQLRRESGGKGQWSGGEGTTKEWTLLEAAELTFMTTRRNTPAYGLKGGGNGLPGEQAIKLPDAPWTTVAASSTHRLRAGSQFRLTTPGGGGWGTETARCSPDKRVAKL